MLRRFSLVALPAAAVLAIFYAAYSLVDPIPMCAENLIRFI
jgi:hypothetical protein